MFHDVDFSDFFMGTGLLTVVSTQQFDNARPTLILTIITQHITKQNKSSFCLA